MNTVPCFRKIIKISGLAKAQGWFLKKDFLSVKLVSLLYIYIYIYIYIYTYVYTYILTRKIMYSW